LAGTTKTPLEAARSAVEVYRERLARVPKVLKNPVIGEDKPKRDRGEGKAVSNAIDIMENIMEKKSDSNILHDKQQLREKYENKEKTKGIAQPQPNLRPPSTPRKKQSVGRVLGIGD
jgi:hypothetical protein